MIGAHTHQAGRPEIAALPRPPEARGGRKTRQHASTGQRAAAERRSIDNAFWQCACGGRRAYWRFCVEASCSSLSDPSTRSKAPRSITSTVVSTVAVTVAARLSAESSASSPAKAKREEAVQMAVQMTHGALWRAGNGGGHYS